jgi:hypothetical protein
MQSILTHNLFSTKTINVFHHRTGHPTERATSHYQNACATITRNTTTFSSNLSNNTILFRIFAIVCVLYFYLAGAGVVSNLTATPTASSCARPLRRRLALIMTPTLLFGNQVSYLTNCERLLCLYIAFLASLLLLDCCGSILSSSGLSSRIVVPLVRFWLLVTPYLALLLLFSIVNSW